MCNTLFRIFYAGFSAILEKKKTCKKKTKLNYPKKEEFQPSSALTVHSKRSPFQNCMKGSPKRCHYKTVVKKCDRNTPDPCQQPERKYHHLCTPGSLIDCQLTRETHCLSGDGRAS